MNITSFRRPLSPCDGFPTSNIFTQMVKAVKVKTFTLTARGCANIELVKAVKVVKAISTYRTCARVCVSLLHNIFYYKNTLDHLDQLNEFADFALTKRLDQA